MNKAIYEVGAAVVDALRMKKPIVALETALLTHGLPEPHNLKTVLDMEEAVAREGAVPCTIGVIRGRAVIGLDRSQLEYLAHVNGTRKLGIRDLPYAAALGLDGGTTVSATAYLAHRFGIRFFATGGIGGVHPGAGQTFDISADLPVLARTPVTVISSGAKAILDLGLTLEYLETAGITVAGFCTDRLPAFYASSSPFPLPYVVDSAAQAAATALARDRLGLTGAVLICNPVPKEAEIPWDELLPLINLAKNEVSASGTAGQDVTPAMLSRLFEVSGGRALRANLALLRENARLGAAIACAAAALWSEEQ